MMMNLAYRLRFFLVAAVLATVWQPSYAEDSFDTANAGFFILSDKSYGSQDEAQIRLEVQDVNTVYNNAGVDVAVYQVPNAIEFLKKQNNLHRINIKAQPAQQGLWHTLIAIWDYIANSARESARQLFSTEARQSTVKTAPDLHAGQGAVMRGSKNNASAYKPLSGFDLVARFRYPLQFGQDIKPAKAVLSGANVEGDIASDEAESNNSGGLFGNGEDEAKAKPKLSNGNVYVPLGKLKPGLYLIEAMLKEQRAVTLVFVSDVLTVSKTSANGMLVWAVDRTSGAPIADVATYWRDGVGELATGTTNAQGWVQMQHAAPEQTYVFAQDKQGGVIISENYYYDSEIYNNKLYATTDRPLYRAGDSVRIKVVGRQFVNARASNPLPDAAMQAAIFDPNGMQVASKSFAFTGSTGGDTQIALPANSASGGYEIQLTYQGEIYTAAFRVADYQKPHFEINIISDKKALKTGSDIPLQLQLRYPDGKPVKEALVDIDLKAQALSMVEGELAYSGLFPIKLTSQQVHTDGSGNAQVTLPQVKEPSRYIVSVLATDGAAYRVRQTQELLIDRAPANWQVRAAQRFTTPDQSVHFDLTADGTAAGLQPAHWKWVRLEDQSSEDGKLSADSLSKGLDIPFKKSGSYTVSVMSEDGTLLGATSHWVSGDDIKVPVGNIEIVWDKSGYRVGETANALISFSEPIENALLTLERDQIEQISLLKQPQAWLKTTRIAPQQWRASVAVTEAFSPNLTLSVAYVKNNEFVFENAGILVKNPQINVKVTPDKASYAPGDTVKLAVDTRLQTADGKLGQPLAAQLSLGVVDEMVYVLQPEIAPNILDFFYHPRRNSVRTQISQAFIGYDVSTDQLGRRPTSHSAQERATKLLERPRRDDVDTAYWAPNLATDANGHVEVSFKMPDSLTRWRITARAMSQDGLVGQATADTLSNKDFYIKWTSPKWLRQRDTALGNLAIFNQTQQVQTAQLVLQGALEQKQEIKLNPGINFVDVPRKGEQSGELTVTLAQGGQVRDQLALNLRSQADGWVTRYNRLLEPQEGNLKLDLPADAQNITLRWMDNNRAAFYRIMDDLIDYPYGCVEQTASRMIPLSLAYRSMAEDDPRRSAITRQLYTQRIRLASMAGSEARFGWWGQDMPENPLLTTYAYYADWFTAQTLNLQLPADHWESLPKLYADKGFEAPFWQRALMLDWMRQIGLPVGSMVAGLAQDLSKEGVVPPAATYGTRDSWLLTDPSQQTHDMAWVMTARLLQQSNQTPPAGFAETAEVAAQRLQAQQGLLPQALLQATGHNSTDINVLLAQAGAQDATIDRALALTWLDNAQMRSTARVQTNPSRGKKSVNPASAAKVEEAAATATAASDAASKAATTTVGAGATTAGKAATTNVAADAHIDSAKAVTAETPLATPATAATDGAAATPVATISPTSAPAVSLPKPWTLKTQGMGVVYAWVTKGAGSTLPQSVPAHSPAVLSYDSTQSGKLSTLPAKLTRNLYLLKPESDGKFVAEEVSANEAITTDALYMEELTLTSSAPLHYMLVEAPLPPGANVEPSTWGINIKDGDALPKANYQDLPGRYAVPLGDVDKAQTVTHLLRFSQRGTYQLPAARAYNMYRPDAQALESQPRKEIKVK